MNMYNYSRHLHMEVKMLLQNSVAEVLEFV